jgi:hypothetical protein
MEASVTTRRCDILHCASNPEVIPLYEIVLLLSNWVSTTILRDEQVCIHRPLTKRHHTQPLPYHFFNRLQYRTSAHHTLSFSR